MSITSDAALAMGMNFLFAIHRPSIPEEVRFYLGLAQDLRFLESWDIDDGILTVTFYEGTQKQLDACSSSTFNFLKEQVEFFAEAISPLSYCPGK